MALKRNTRDATPSSTRAAATTESSTTATSSVPAAAPSKASTKRGSQNPLEIAVGVWENYLETTPQRTKLTDIFMAFLVVVGGLQFAYCLISGNYPFNAFLSGFSATVGQFVLTASLRIQTNEENKGEFGAVSPERAFADYVFGSLILHFFCVNFIN